MRTPPFGKQWLKPMVSTYLLAISCLFFVIGHSALVHFKGEEVSHMSIRELLFPWPKRGKFLSLLCIGFCLLCLLLFLWLPSDLSPSRVWPVLDIVLVTGVAPVLMYSLYISRRIHRKSGVIAFYPSRATPMEWRIPLFIVAVTSILYFI